MSATTKRPLFRIEAMQARRGRLYDGAPMRAPVTLAVMTTSLAAAVVAIGIFLATQTYARKAAATGYLAPRHGVIQVIPPRAGLIMSVAVTEGDVVHAGDPLLQIAAERTSATGTDIDASVRRALTQQRDMQLTQITLEQSNESAQAQQLGDRIVHLQAEAQSLRQQLTSQVSRVTLANEQASVSRDLAAAGYVSGVEQRRREDARLGQVQALDGLQQQIAAKEGEIANLRNDLAQLPNRTAARIASLQAAAAEIDSRLADTEGQRAYQITAPISGRISTLQANAGNGADPSHPLLSIVPEAEPLQAILFVPEKAIGFVAVGQQVRLSLDAFPFQRFGALDGTVIDIARTLLRPEQLTGVTQIPTEPSYLVRVALGRQSMTAYGKAVPLQADMQLRADIIFDRRSFGQWLLDPVLSSRGRI